MLTVLPLVPQTSTKHCLESQPQRTQERSGIIDLFTVCCCHTDLNESCDLFPSCFTFTEITDCFYNECVFNVNVSVNENFVYSHAVTDAFCP